MHTETTMRAAFEVAEELGVGKMLVASTSSETCVKAAEMYEGKE